MLMLMNLGFKPLSTTGTENRDACWLAYGLQRGCLTWCSDLQQGFSYSRCGSLQMPAFICENMLILAAPWRFHIYPGPCIPVSTSSLSLTTWGPGWYDDLDNSPTQNATLSALSPKKKHFPQRHQCHPVSRIDTRCRTSVTILGPCMRPPTACYDPCWVASTGASFASWLCLQCFAWCFMN